MSKTVVKRKENSRLDKTKKKLKKNPLSENDSKTESDFNEEQVISDENVVYNMPKPGPHAKVYIFISFLIRLF